MGLHVKRPVIWCKERSTDWWMGVVRGDYGDEWWYNNLRMSKETFDSLCLEIRPYLERQDTRFRQAVSVER